MSQPQWAGPQQQWRPQTQATPGAVGSAGWLAGAVPSLRAWVRASSAPAARQKSPQRWLLLALMALGLLALAGLVLVNVTAKPAEVAYANDDYQVPAPELNPPQIPIPETLEQGRVDGEQRGLRRFAPALVRCNEPAIDVATASDVALKTHFENLMECLVRVWQLPLTQAGFQIFRPTVTIYAEEITTKCGAGKFPQNAFYCGADQQIYWSNTLGPVLTPFRESKYAGDYVMAHEFGHAIQGRTGILTSRNWLLSETPDKDVQGSCCGGGPRSRPTASPASSCARSRSPADSPRPTPTPCKGFYNGGDDVLSRDPDIVGDHGRGVSRQFWGTTGLGTGEAGKCNTFVAPSNQVR